MSIQTDEVQRLVARGALFVVNHSGGKDSQAMYWCCGNSCPRIYLSWCTPILERLNGPGRSATSSPRQQARSSTPAMRDATCFR